MTLGEFIDKLDTMPREEFDLYDKAVWEMLTPISRRTMFNLSREFAINAKDYEEYLASANKCLRECVEIETSPVGTIIREVINLPPITMNTEITANKSHVDKFHIS